MSGIPDRRHDLEICGVCKTPAKRLAPVDGLRMRLCKNCRRRHVAAAKRRNETGSHKPSGAQLRRTKT
jgi:hypothetical protein